MRAYLPALDILRFGAFLAVFVHHVFPQEADRYLAMGFSSFLSHIFAGLILSGSLGVDLFFVLSSYLITRLLRAEITATGNFSLGRFWARRALRIWPLYFLFLGIAVWIVPRYLVPNESLQGYLLAYLLFYGNWACVFWGYPHSTAVHLWSVSIEEQFYLLWPLLLKVFGTHRIPQLGSVLLFAGICTRGILLFQNARHPEFWCNTLAHIDPIVIGAFIAYWEEQLFALWQRLPRLPLFLGSFFLPALFCVFFQMEVLSGWPVFFFLPLSALCCGFLLLSFLKGRTVNATPGFLLRPLLYLGKISYGLYVWHFLVVRFLRLNLSPERLGVPELSALVVQLFTGLAITIILAALSYELYEWPFLRLKSRFAAASGGGLSSDASRDSHKL